MRAELLSIGTELLLGQITDTNSAYLAARLAGLGIDLLHLSTVGDNLGRATAAFQLGLGRSELIVTTGGLGPTEDDLTREAIAAAVGERPSVDPRLERELGDWFALRGVAMPERNRKQAWLIPSARAIPNPHGTAPGWDVRIPSGAAGRGSRIVSMPGVPREMTRMWEDEVEPTLLAGSLLRSRTLKFLGIGESAVEEALDELVRSTAPTVATYAKNDGVHVRITDKGPLAPPVEARIAAMERVVRDRVGSHIWGTDADTLGSVIGTALRDRGWRLAVAESLTGGEVGRALSETAGSGDWLTAAVTVPGAGTPDLERAAASFPAEVRLIVPDGAAVATLIVRTPERAERRRTIRFGSLLEGRRRATLAALDLLRRALSGVDGIGDDPD